ncbi:MAG: hydrogenase expression/formation protein HypE [Clostridiales Family XIII bacterium]|nr:hydrogenase expression/formation protein HypE [Clostridiales Family XIII bacterium]
MKNETTITTAHGSGGRDTALLVEKVFRRRLSNDILDRMDDAAVLGIGGRLAVTTDSFVVTPLFFSGGDIGKLSVCGTVNDLLAVGAEPKYMTCGFILEEGLELSRLERVVESMAREAAAAGVRVVAGDTKVIEGKGGMYINACGIGALSDGREIGSESCVAGDKVLVSGTLGDHHACILSARMGIENSIVSDCACLNDVAEALIASKVKVRAMRDVTRGGLATVLNEIAAASGIFVELDEEAIPVGVEVKALCGLMGLDPLYMGNEGKMVVIVSGNDAEKALRAMRETKHGKDAEIVGHVVNSTRDENQAKAAKPDAMTKDLIMNQGVVVKTKLGGRRRLDMLHGEGLPRIC